MSGRSRAKTPLGRGNLPFAPGVTKTGAEGPWARLKTELKLFGGFSCCSWSTGRFWVTACPKMDPKTPVS